MLIKATLEDIKNMESLLIALLSIRQSHAIQPTQTVLKPRQISFKAAEGAIAKETYELLLFSMDGNIEGWISYY